MTTKLFHWEGEHCRVLSSFDRRKKGAALTLDLGYMPWSYARSFHLILALGPWRFQILFEISRRKDRKGVDSL